jgi:hypothetical protein
MTVPVQSNAEKVANALHRMSQIDPAILQTAEKYPRTLKTVLAAAVKSDEE